MEFRATLSLARHRRQVVDELCADMIDFEPDLAMMFVSPHHGPGYEKLVKSVCARLNARNLIGCTGESIIGPDREIESAPAAVVWAARLPGVRVLPFVIDQEDVQSLTKPADWIDRLGVVPQDRPVLIVLPDPFTIAFDSCLTQLEAAFPGCKIIGGMASGASAPGYHRLFQNDQVLRQGAVGVSLTGPVEIDTVVSQGCRPVGRPFVITRAEQNLIVELGGRPAYDVLGDVFREAPPEDQALMRQGLHVGRVIDERLQAFKTGDFLIRNMAGVVDSKALAVADFFRAGQTVQFHVRDAATADEDMRSMLSRLLARDVPRPRGGLLFTCNGRGTHLFGTANHDISVINDLAPECKVAGFFAQGEIGPVGGRTFVHGFTSSMVLMREPGSAGVGDP